MWRIHLSTDDIRRVRLAPAIDPMWELVHGLQAITNGVGGLVFDPWRRKVRLHRPARWRALQTLVPAWGYSPDFLTPVAGTTDLREGFEAVLRTPRTTLRTDLGRLGDETPLPGWARSLASGDPETLRRLVTALGRFHAAHLAPYWGEMRRQVNEELLTQRRTLCAQGIDGLLSGIGGTLRWEPPAIVLVNKRSELDIELGGRGVVLQPSFFAFNDITLMDLPGEPMVLIYPVSHRLGWLDPGAAGARLEDLLSRTRAAMLDCLAGGSCTTSELAKRLDISQASSSEQTKILREAGLIISDRDGRRVVHTASELGLTLLSQGA